MLFMMAMSWWWKQKIPVFTFSEYGSHLNKFELERSHGYGPAKLASHRTGARVIVVSTDVEKRPYECGNKHQRWRVDAQRANPSRRYLNGSRHPNDH